MSNQEMRDKILNMLGENRELHILRGKLGALQLATTKDGENYYQFDIKCVRQFTSDEYGTGFNSYHCIMSVEKSKEFTKENMVQFKDCEVLCIVNQNSIVRTLNKNGSNDKFKVNNTTLYVQDLIYVREINKSFEQKTINL